jgi:gliding motility-associated-like protein
LSNSTLFKLTVTLIFSLVLSGRVIGQLPLASFSATPTAGCSPLLVGFYDQSTGGPTAWAWDFGNGSTSTVQNPTSLFFAPGTYNIKLTVTNANGTNTLVRSQYITVYETPTVDFGGQPRTGCFPVRVQFNDLSTAGAGNTNTGWLWDFGNGSQSVLQNPLNSYYTGGLFAVTLKVTNDKGCYKVATKPNYVNVSPGVKADYSHSDATVCRPPTTISFVNASTGPGSLSYSWDFADGVTSTSQNPVHTFLTGGNRDVTLVTTSSGGCIDTVKHTIYILNYSTGILSVDSACVNSTVHFLNAAVPPPQSSSWNFGDGSTGNTITGVNTYNSVGDFTVRLINTYANCYDSAAKTISIKPKPTPNFIAPLTSKCQPPFTVNFQDQSSGAVAWQWFFGDGTTSNQQNPSHTYNSYGSFDVKLVARNSSGCTDTIIKPQYIIIRRAQISIPALPAKGCVPYTINPVPTINSVDAITSYLWNFGDGSTSASQNPSHVYPFQGTYTVKLYITTSSGCTDSLVMPAGVRVGTKPSANFSYDPTVLCAMRPFQFADLTPQPVNEWLWNFGDGSSSTSQNPSHAYDAVGTFSVTLIATNNGCPDTITKQNILTVLAPVPVFTATANCSNRLQFGFTDQSLGAQTWSWNFGDGSSSTAQNPVHNFPALGAYNVTLTVSNGSCTNSLTKIVNAIDENPNFVSPATTYCKPALVNFSAQIINAANIANYSWRFGNGLQHDTSAGTSSTLYAASGIYTVTLVTTDINSCKDTIARTNYIRVNGPKASFSSPDSLGCKGRTVTFNDLSTTDGINAIKQWTWDFGDGNVSTFTSPPFQHLYDTLGSFDVKLKIVDAAGCSDSLKISRFIKTSDPQPLFFSEDLLTCPSSIVHFYDTTLNAVGYTSSWDFGDGGTSSLKMPTHSYADTGLYTIKLSITDRYNCTHSIVKDQYIKVSKPMAGFTISDSASTCLPFEVKFTNTSQYSYNSLWDFGDGGTSSYGNPIHYYSDIGSFTAKLVVTSFGGCQDSITRTIYTYDTAGSRIDYVPLAGCNPLLVSLRGYSPAPVKYLWDFGDGVTIDTTASVLDHRYHSIGNFVPRVVMKSSEGCLVPITGPDTIRIIGANAKFGIDKPLLCDRGIAHFSDSSINNDQIVGYYWNFGDGTTSAQQSPSHQFNSTGIYDISFIVQTQVGCSDTAHEVFRVVASPSIAVDGDSTACIHDSMLQSGIFLATDTSKVKWLWNFPNGNNLVGQNPPRQKYDSAGNFFVTAIATNSSGCTDTARKSITVHPLPMVTMPSTITMAPGFPITIPATYSQTIATSLWSPSSSLSCVNCLQPIANPKFTTKYKVDFVDVHGCKNSGLITVAVICKDANVFLPNTFSPNGDGNNDVFYPRGKGIFRVKTLRIFDRWGEVVFEAKDFQVNNPDYGWNGNYKGSRPLPGVYVVQLEFYCDNGELIRLDGNVALIL